MNVRLKYDMLFVAGMYHADSLRMNNYNLRLWMLTNTENSHDQNISFERLKYFMYNQMNNTVFINEENQKQCEKLVKAGLNITTLPGDPSDQLIGIMLYHKLNAIMEDRMSVIETELSSTYGDNMTYLHGEGESTWGIAPQDWWSTPDLIHSNFMLHDSDNIVSMNTVTAWRDLELCWDEQPIPTNTGNIVVFADFNSEHETK